MLAVPYSYLVYPSYAADADDERDSVDLGGSKKKKKKRAKQKKKKKKKKKKHNKSTATLEYI